MPGLVRKLLIYAAVDGLILQPVAQRNQRAGATVKIDYGTRAITPLLRDVDSEKDGVASFEAYGIIGTLTLLEVDSMSARRCSW